MVSQRTILRWLAFATILLFAPAAARGSDAGTAGTMCPSGAGCETDEASSCHSGGSKLEENAYCNESGSCTTCCPGDPSDSCAYNKIWFGGYKNAGAHKCGDS